MTNRVEYRDADAQHLIRNFNKANITIAPYGMFAPDRNRYSVPTAPTYQFVDISTALMATGNKSKPDLRSSLEAKFREYADKWYAETIRESSFTKLMSNVNYLKVIKLGSDVVPLISKELQSDDPAPWFLALRVLTEETEVGRGYPGNFVEKAKAWVAWGKERGLIV